MPASTCDALDMLRAAVDYLAASDPAQMTASEQAGCLLAMERADAVGTAARAGILTAFTAGQGYAADADYSVRAWLIHKAKVTRGAAAGHIAWMRRAVTHPLVIAALTEGALTESMARVICRWTGRLPRNCVDTADEILVTAAGAGAEEADIAAWPPRCTHARSPGSARKGSRTGRSGWRPPSRARAC
jgi:hypothetical protein